MGDFPFREFVRFISGRSRYELDKAVREFCAGLKEDTPESLSADETIKNREVEIAMKCLEVGLKVAKTAEVLWKHPDTICNWKKEYLNR